MTLLADHTLTYHPVGQGAFHSGRLQYISSDATLRGFNYVFDCGAMPKFAAARTAAVDIYIDLVRKSGEKLDIVFISHAHEDHVNGIAQLLDPVRGLHAETAVMPLMSPTERLIDYSRSLHLGGISAGSRDFYIEFVIDPVTTLQNLGVSRVLVVASGGEGAFGNQIDSVDRNDGDGDGDGDETQSDFGGDSSEWRVVGAAVDPSVSGTVNIRDSAAIAIPTGHRSVSWLLAPFVPSGASAGISIFRAVLSPLIEVPEGLLEAWLADPTNMRTVLIRHAKALRTAYAAVVGAKELNSTSLCLYSGLSSDIAPQSKIVSTGLVRPRSVQDWRDEQRAGVLFNGDAELKRPEVRKEYLNHFGLHLNRVGTFTLAHHGSDANFHDDLLDRINPEYCVATADRFKDWRHPGSRVMQDAASRGMIVSVVTSDPRSAHTETSYL